MPITLYEVLGVDREASSLQIAKAYRQLAKIYHPDRSGNDPKKLRRFLLVQRAYEVLSDSKARIAYDKKLELQQSRPRTQEGDRDFEEFLTRLREHEGPHPPTQKTSQGDRVTCPRCAWPHGWHRASQTCSICGWPGDYVTAAEHYDMDQVFGAKRQTAWQKFVDKDRNADAVIRLILIPGVFLAVLILLKIIGQIFG